MSDFSPEKFLGLSPEEQKAELERLLAQGRAEDLLQLKPLAKDKALKREISRALHRLRSKGVKVAEPAETRTFTLPVSKEPEQAAVSAVDGDGGRLLWLYRPTPEGGALFQGMTSFARGLYRLETYSATAKKFEKILKAIGQEANAVIVRVEAGFARRLIFQAVEFGRRRGAQPPKAFLEFQDRLGPAPDLSAPHPLFAALDVEAVRSRSALAYESPRLLSHPAFVGWFFDEDSIRKCALQLEEAEVSPLVMPEPQKRQRSEQLISEAAREALAGHGREVWKERLGENAYVLHLAGEKVLAEISLATALALDDPASLPPLFPAMMQRAFRPVEAKAPEPEKTDGRIIIP